MRSMSSPTPDPAAVFANLEAQLRAAERAGWDRLDRSQLEAGLPGLASVIDAAAGPVGYEVLEAAWEASEAAAALITDEESPESADELRSATSALLRVASAALRGEAVLVSAEALLPQRARVLAAACCLEAGAVGEAVAWLQQLERQALDLALETRTQLLWQRIAEETHEIPAAVIGEAPLVLSEDASMLASAAVLLQEWRTGRDLQSRVRAGAMLDDLGRRAILATSPTGGVALAAHRDRVAISTAVLAGLMRAQRAEGAAVEAQIEAAASLLGELVVADLAHGAAAVSIAADRIEALRPVGLDADIQQALQVLTAYSAALVAQTAAAAAASVGASPGLEIDGEQREVLARLWQVEAARAQERAEGGARCLEALREAGALDPRSFEGAAAGGAAALELLSLCVLRELTGRVLAPGEEVLSSEALEEAWAGVEAHLAGAPPQGDPGTWLLEVRRHLSGLLDLHELLGQREIELAEAAATWRERVEGGIATCASCLGALQHTPALAAMVGAGTRRTPEIRAEEWASTLCSELIRAQIVLARGPHAAAGAALIALALRGLGIELVGGEPETTATARAAAGEAGEGEDDASSGSGEVSEPGAASDQAAPGEVGTPASGVPSGQWAQAARASSAVSVLGLARAAGVEGEAALRCVSEVAPVALEQVRTAGDASSAGSLCLTLLGGVPAPAEVDAGVVQGCDAVCELVVLVAPRTPGGSLVLRPVQVAGLVEACRTSRRRGSGAVAARALSVSLGAEGLVPGRLVGDTGAGAAIRRGRWSELAELATLGARLGAPLPTPRPPTWMILARQTLALELGIIAVRARHSGAEELLSALVEPVAHAAATVEHEALRAAAQRSASEAQQLLATLRADVPSSDEALSED